MAWPILHMRLTKYCSLRSLRVVLLNEQEKMDHKLLRAGCNFPSYNIIFLGWLKESKCPGFKGLHWFTTKERVCIPGRRDGGAQLESGLDIVSLLPSQPGGSWPHQAIILPTPSTLVIASLTQAMRLAILLGCTETGIMEMGRRYVIQWYLRVWRLPRCFG